MKALLSLALMLIGLLTFSIAQEAPARNCPAIIVTGPSGWVNVGELAPYSVTVSNADQYSLQYVWSVSAGRIKDGQGTSSIRVIQPNSAFTATVEIIGLPDGCPAIASEHLTWDPAPVPVKIYDLQPNESFDKAAATRISEVILEIAGSQLYILAGDVGGKNASSFQRKQRTIVDMLSKLGITRDRITIAPVHSEVELFQFWRVPPGASNPRCDECEKLEKASKTCPTISITGPAGITLPGENMTFVATLTGAVPKRASYTWSIADGKIIDGQGTLKLTARYGRPTKSGYIVTATLTVLGLPEECPRTASEVYAINITLAPEKLGSINNPAHAISKMLLKKIAASLRQSPHSQLYVWVYLGADEAKFPRLRAHLLEQLSGTKVDPARFTIMGTSENGRGATFWRVQPGVSNPAP